MTAIFHQSNSSRPLGKTTVLLMISLLTHGPAAWGEPPASRSERQFDSPAVQFVAAQPPTLNGEPAEPEPDAPGSPLAELQQLLQRPVLVPALAQEVTTVARQPSTIGRSPAAVFVVDQEMIRRSGARSIPEVLRLVPGLYVARINASVWSITSRGFAGRFANKLLVQIDGRTVYTPIFGGTFWDIQEIGRAHV